MLGGALLVAPWSLSPLVREATAQGAPVSQERLEQSRRAMEEGQGLYGQKKYAEAAQAFQRAYAAQPFAAFLFNEAVCHEKLGDSPYVKRCFIRHAFRYFMGRDENRTDACTLASMEQAYDTNNGSFRAMVTALMTSDTWTTRRVPAQGE